MPCNCKRADCRAVRDVPRAPALAARCTVGTGVGSCRAPLVARAYCPPCVMPCVECPLRARAPRARNEWRLAWRAENRIDEV